MRKKKLKRGRRRERMIRDIYKIINRDVSPSHGNIVDGSGRFVSNRTVIDLREKLITFMELNLPDGKRVLQTCTIRLAMDRSPREGGGGEERRHMEFNYSYENKYNLSTRGLFGQLFGELLTNLDYGCHQHNPASLLLRRSKPRAVAQQPHLESKTWRKHVSTPVSDKIVFLRSVRQHHFILPLFKLILSLSLRPSFVLVLNFLKLFNILFFSEALTGLS
ncbi:probable acyl-CoA dehydrogenase IBR3 isoform X2 [Brassica napus]|uniref:probable acyl-CoA dehydrogenase IBR3 isoform X2 n=1 Tax=Brassica napus TaxID=3708 RepID=UPI0006AB1FD0|nr:probable acyl-CoA dehydrogenase IBR3 isoform X2 [Brassica napus]